MGVYTNEAKERLGDDVWEEIMKSVNKGVIDGDKMQDIASSLTEKVGGMKGITRELSRYFTRREPTEWPRPAEPGH